MLSVSIRKNLLKLTSSIIFATKRYITFTMESLSSRIAYKGVKVNMVNVLK